MVNFKKGNDMKTLTYSIMHFIVAFAVSFVLTGDIAIAGAIAMVEPLVQTLAYFLHEKAWNNYVIHKSNSNISKTEYKFKIQHLFIHQP